MDFKDFQYILAIGKYGNITKAAEALYLTQPSLSRFLQNMEGELGQPLFKRMGNRYIPTYIGERYMERAREILHIKKELDQEVSDIVKNDVGLLKIGFPAMRGTYMLPCTLPIFRSLYPRVKIQIREAKSDQLNDLILEGDIDLAFYNYVEKSPNIAYDIISHEELLLVISKKNPLCQKGKVIANAKYPHMDLKFLKDQNMIMQIPGQRTRQLVDRILHEEHIEPNIVLETSNIQAEADLVCHNYGIAFITETHLKHMNLNDQLQCFSIGHPKTTVDFVAAYRQKSYLPYHAQEYIKIVRDFT